MSRLLERKGEVGRKRVAGDGGYQYKSRMTTLVR